MRIHILAGLAVCLLLTGCDDSKNPLSDPNTSKADQRLIGLWHSPGKNGATTCYHIGRAGKGFPAGAMRIVEVQHGTGTVDAPEEYLAFCTSIGAKHYLSVVLDGEKKVVKLLDQKGWLPDAVDSYTIIRYEVRGDKMTAWAVDEDAKERAIKSGKIRGTSAPNQLYRITDTPENLRRFLSEAGDSLFNTKEPLPLERIEMPEK